MAFSTIILIGGILMLLMHRRTHNPQTTNLFGFFLASAGVFGIVFYFVGGGHLMSFVVPLALLAAVAGAWLIYSSRARRKQNSNNLG